MNKKDFITILKQNLKREENDKKIVKKLLSDLKSYEGKTITARIKNKSNLIKRYEDTSSYIRVFVKGLSGFAYINLARKDNNKIYNERWIREENPAYFMGVDERIIKLKKILSNKPILDSEYDKYKKIDSAVRTLKKVSPELDFNNPAHYSILKKIGSDTLGRDKRDDITKLLRLVY